MQIVVVILLAVFLLTSAAERDPKPTANNTNTQDAKSIQYTQPRNTSSFTYKKPGAYEHADSWKIRSFIKKFRKNDPEYLIDIYANAIIKYGKIHDVDPKLMAGLIARESSFDPKAKSSSDAMGLGQIKAINFEMTGITDPYNPEQNIKGVAVLLRDLINKWQDHSKPIVFALASYKEGYYGIKKKGAYTPETEIYINDILRFRDEIK